MENLLRILIIEDLPSDAELAERELRAVIKNYRVQVVDTKKEFEKALETFKPDLIISDYQMPVFDGLSALKIKQKKTPNTPFVILTGSMNEETAIECMHAGADDYVIKEHIKRLGQAALKAIEKKKNELAFKQAEEALHRSEELNRSITQTAADAIISINSDGIILSWNNAAEKLFGYSTSRMINKNLSEIIPIQYKNGHVSGINRLKNGGKGNLIGQIIELTAHRKDGTEFPIELSLSSWETNNQKYFTGIIRDITERKQVNEALIKSEALLAETGRMAKVGGWEIDALTSDVSWTEETYRIHEVPMSTKPPLEEAINFFHPDDRPKLETAIQKALKQGKPYNMVIRFITAKGKNLWTHTTCKPIIVDGKIVKLTGTFQDVTEQKKNEKELKKHRDNLEELVKKRTAELRFANDELAKADGMKDEFLANMSHELRTPLNAVLGLSESLQEEIYGKLNEKQSERIHNIEESGRHLLNLINEILDLAKIGAGKIVLEYNRISIEELMQSSLRFIKQTAFNKKIKVSTGISATIETFRADEKRMKQILVNLLSNAVKFTPDEGQIGLEVDLNEENQTISFIVWDTGIGISNENLDKLFQPFVQIDSSLSRQNEGTGLGLALVNKLTSLHNGSITVESKVEKGSRFIVTIPINENAEG